MKKFIKRFYRAMFCLGMFVLMSVLVAYPIEQALYCGKDVWLWALPVSLSFDWALFWLFVDVIERWDEL